MNSFPILTFNYLLYKDKGLVDLQFSRFFGIAKETYKPIEATIQPFSLNTLLFSNNPGIVTGISFFWNFDKLIFILGILGFLTALLIKKEYLLLWILAFLFPFLFLSGTSLLEYHFIFGMPILAFFSAVFVEFLVEKLSKFKLKKNTILAVCLLIIIIFNISYVSARGIFSKSEVTKMMTFSKEYIEDDSLVVIDSRVYRGRIVWIFNDKNYLEANFLNDLTRSQENLPGDYAPLKTYFIECVTDDCGWGTVNSQPEFNQSMESITDFFKNNSRHFSTIQTRDKEDYFNVYETNLNLKPASLELAKSTHEWFYYPLRYERESFDDYQTKGFDKFLDFIAHLILYIEVLIALLAIILTFYILAKDEKVE